MNTLTILNCYFKLLTLIVNICTVTLLDSFLTLIPLQQLIGPSQNSVLAFSSVIMLYIFHIPRVTQFIEWSRESSTILVKTISHINTFNQFQVRFKTRFTTKNHKQRRFVTCFSRHCHLHNRRVQKASCSLWFWVECWS